MRCRNPFQLQCNGPRGRIERSPPSRKPSIAQSESAIDIVSLETLKDGVTFIRNTDVKGERWLSNFDYDMEDFMDNEGRFYVWNVNEEGVDVNALGYSSRGNALRDGS